MSQTVLERTAEHIAESAHQASRATCAVADAIGWRRSGETCRKTG